MNSGNNNTNTQKDDSGMQSTARDGMKLLIVLILLAGVALGIILSK